MQPMITHLVGRDVFLVIFVRVQTYIVSFICELVKFVVAHDLLIFLSGCLKMMQKRCRFEPKKVVKIKFISKLSILGDDKKSLTSCRDTSELFSEIEEKKYRQVSNLVQNHCFFEEATLIGLKPFMVREHE
jgi:hypothetical protein